MELIKINTIKKKILENYIDYQYLFLEFQSNFLSNLYSRYQSIENGNLVLYFAKQTHQSILRKKDYDLDSDISYEKFWINHGETDTMRNPLIKIAEDVLLPKETVRRKILQLTKQKVIGKKKKNICWLPNDQYKQSYNLLTSKEINDVCKLIMFICEKTKFSISREDLIKEIKEKFSFYWFHYLSTQIEYLKLWSKQLNDIELGLIFIQVVHVFVKTTKEKNLSHQNIFDDPGLLKEFTSASVSATSVAEVTGIPRATCVRKLESLVKLKAILQDEISKRYYLVPGVAAEDLISRKLTENIVGLFSKFYFICIKSVQPKI
jgi:hypothetical protein